MTLFTKVQEERERGRCCCCYKIEIIKAYYGDKYYIYILLPFIT